jgi:tetratricopeptide (TPR) repeat protein
MGLLDKIGDKLSEKLDDVLNSDTQVQSTTPKTLAELTDEESAKNIKKYYDEIDSLGKKMSKISEKEDFDEHEYLECCFKILEFDPQNFNTKLSLFSTLCRMGEADRAYSMCVSMIETYPNNSHVDSKMADILLSTKDYDNAIAYYEKVIQKIPRTEYLSLHAKQGKAYALFDKEDYYGAIQFCDEQLPIHENDTSLTNLKIEALEAIQALNDKEKSNEQIQKSNNTPEQPIPESSQQQSDTSDVSIPDQISKFAKLKEQGLISDEEFIEMKQKLMKKI